MKLKIPQATSRGYIECEENGCFDWTYPTSKLRRGRVQGGGGQLEHADMLDCYNQSVLKDIAVTITTRIDHCNHYWVVEKVKYERGNDDSGKREEA